MKSSRFQFKYRKNASKLHKKVGDLLRSSDYFKHYEIYQEYPVVRINPKYKYTRHHFDWVIPKLQLVLECHGRQHFQSVAFDGDQEKAIENFKELQIRDTIKKEAAIAAGYSFLEIPYTLEKDLTEDVLLDLIKNNKNVGIPNQSVSTETELQKDFKQKQKERRIQQLHSEQHQQSLAKARDFRREQYKKLKQRKIERE